MVVIRGLLRERQFIRAPIKIICLRPFDAIFSWISKLADHPDNRKENPLEILSESFLTNATLLYVQVLIVLFAFLPSSLEKLNLSWPRFLSKIIAY